MAQSRIKKEAKFHPLELIYPRSLKFLNSKLHELVEGQLWVKVLIGMILGVAFGFLLGPSTGILSVKTAKMFGEWLALPGVLFIKVIQMVVIPLIFASIVKGIASSENIKQLKKTGIAVALYFIATTVVAILIGILLASALKPGLYMQNSQIQEIQGEVQLDPSVADATAPSFYELPSIISHILPTNLLGSILNGQMLQIVIFTIIFGIALVNMDHKKSRPILEILGAVQIVCMNIVKWAMLLAPIAVFGLMANLTIQFGLETLYGIGIYLLTVFLGLIILLVLYMTIVYISSKRTPLDFLKRIKDVQLLAFSTSSSAAVMPLTIKTAEEQLDVRPALSQFIIPIGTTINMDGTALYQTIATLFLAQVFGIELSFTAMILLIITIVGASIGSPATPGVGMAILAIVLTSLGIPLEGLALILGVDRLLDMSRTAVNVTGDLTSAVFINRFVGGNRTVQEALKLEEKHEHQRKLTGYDVVFHKA